MGQDVNPSRLAWCFEDLGIDTIQSAYQIQDIKIEEAQYSLIWVGSVFTHISTASSNHFLCQLALGMWPNGLYFLTTAGQHAADGFQPVNEALLNPEPAEIHVLHCRNVDCDCAPYGGSQY
jgi:hypothetical protein